MSCTPRWAWLPPALLAFAQFDAWWPMLATLGLFLALDLVTAYGVEPIAIGRRTAKQVPVAVFSGLVSCSFLCRSITSA